MASLGFSTHVSAGTDAGGLADGWR